MVAGQGLQPAGVGQRRLLQLRMRQGRGLRPQFGHQEGEVGAVAADQDLHGAGQRVQELKKLASRACCSASPQAEVDRGGHTHQRPPPARLDPPLPAGSRPQTGSWSGAIGGPGRPAPAGAGDAVGGHHQGRAAATTPARPPRDDPAATHHQPNAIAIVASAAGRPIPRRLAGPPTAPAASPGSRRPPRCRRGWRAAGR